MLMAMELDHVEAFVAIAKSGGFTRASSELNLSQPAISRRVKLLEEELGAPLFDRMPTGVAINDAGRAFLPHAEALLASMRDGIDAVRAVRGAEHGVVTLAIVGTLASTTLTRHLRRFRDAHPGIDLRLRTALSAEVSALVLCGDATLGLRYDKDPNPQLVSTWIHEEPMFAVCSSRHRLARARRVSPKDLAGERWLTFPTQAGAAREPYASALERLLATTHRGAHEIVPIDSLTAQKRMVEAGFGLALLPESSVVEELRAGTLCRLKITGFDVRLPVVLIHRRHAFQSGATKKLMAMLIDTRGSRAPRGPRARPAR